MKILIGKIFRKIVSTAKLIIQADEIIGLLKKDSEKKEAEKPDETADKKNPPQGGDR